MEKKYNYVYEIVNHVNFKFYIGVHSTNNLSDGYFGSGKLLKKAIDKHGIDNFTLRIVSYFADRKSALLYEYTCISKEMIKSDYCYNLKNGGNGGGIIGHIVSEETREKISSKQRGIKKSKEHCELRRKQQIGKKLTEETKRKMSESRLGELNPAYGKPSHKRNTYVWDNYDKIKDIWLINGKVGYYKLGRILVEDYGFPSYNYQKIYLKIIKEI